MLKNIYNYVASWFIPGVQLKKKKVYLTIPQVAEILRKINNEEYTSTEELAKEYNVSSSYISKIRNGTHYMYNPAVAYNEHHEAVETITVGEYMSAPYKTEPKPRKAKKTYNRLSNAEVKEIETILTNHPEVAIATIVGTYNSSSSVMSKIVAGTHPKSSSGYRATVLAKG